jgi:glycosyltransferase involved in cell wall biosynthesis
MIPTFNQEDSIGRAIESCLMQDYPNLEIVVSDDCSTDGSADVIAGYLEDSRLKFFRNEINLGRVANYRRSLYERITGAWTLNLDGDDYLHGNDVISCLVSEILQHPTEGIVAVMGSQLTTDVALGRSTKRPARSVPGLYEGADLFLGWDRMYFGHLATLYKVDLARSIDYYRSDTISSDWESILRLMLLGKVAVLDKVIAVWSIHGKNISSRRDMTNAIDDYNYIEASYSDAIEKGVNRGRLARWHRRMVRMQTRSLWSSNIPMSYKIRCLVPFVARRYPFAIGEFFLPKAIALNILREFPALFTRVRALYFKLTDGRAVAE